jgi:hypothetical protein
MVYADTMLSILLITAAASSIMSWTQLTDTIKQVLIEARVILPGIPAFLGF